MAHVSLEKQLKNMLKGGNSSLNLSKNGTFNSVLKAAAEKLLDILEEEIEKVYSRTSGKYPWYDRSNDFRNSLDKSLVVDPKTNTITIGFIPGLAWHDSWLTKIGGSGDQAYVPQAIREGYEIFNTGVYVEGMDFVQNAIDRFNAIKRDGITVAVDDDSVAGKWWG